MSDHQSEVSPTGSGVEAQSASFSKNGSDPGDPSATAYDASAKSDDGATFLADLAKAMQSTAAAEQTRNAETTEQKRQAHIDAIRAREALEAEQLRELAKDDVKGIDAWSDGEIKRVKLERERRIAARREQLQIRLEEHRTVVGREVDAVESAVASYRAEIDEYFRRLEGETDPVAIARHAGSRPAFPDLEQIGPDEAPQVSTYAATATPAVATEAPAADAPIASGDAAADDQDHDAPANGSMVGVMDPGAQTETPADPWTGKPIVEAEPVAEAQPVAEAEADTQPVAEGQAVERGRVRAGRRGPARGRRASRVGVGDARDRFCGRDGFVRIVRRVAGTGGGACRGPGRDAARLRRRIVAALAEQLVGPHRLELAG